MTDWLSLSVRNKFGVLYTNKSKYSPGVRTHLELIYHWTYVVCTNKFPSDRLQRPACPLKILRALLNYICVSLIGSAPAYLCELCSSEAEVPGRRVLRSSVS